MIDASIAHSAGSGTAFDQTSINCREFLRGVLRICHKMVMTPKLQKEWERHQSNFSTDWRNSMESKGKVFWPEVASIPSVTPDIELAARSLLGSSPGKVRGAVKDSLLVEAALAADKTIVSLDEKARGLFSDLIAEFAPLKEIVWVNPDRVDSEEPLRWLEKGAPPEKKRRLKRTLKETR